MARKPRIEYPGAIYHVMSRGDRQEAIYHDDKDCRLFLDTLNEACTKTGWLVHAFVLMGNHYHLLLETPEANLVAGMKWLQGTYTQRFNARHKLWGHLLQGRYKALVVEGGAGDYFSTLSSYIHLNPVRSGVLKLQQGELADYRWSSFPLYLRPSKRPAWLVVDRVLGELGVEDNRSGIVWYRNYMKRREQEVRGADNPWAADLAWSKIGRGWYLGSDAFRDDLLGRLDEVVQGRKRSSFCGAEVRRHDEAEAERLLAKGLKCLGMAPEDLKKLPKGQPEKAVLAWYLRKNTTVSRSWVSARLFMGDESRITKLVAAVDREHDYKELKKRLHRIPEFTD